MNVIDLLVNASDPTNPNYAKAIRIGNEFLVNHDPTFFEANLLILESKDDIPINIKFISFTIIRKYLEASIKTKSNLNYSSFSETIIFRII